MTATGDIGASEQPQQMQAGDRLWFWFPDEPSAFETLLGDTLAVFPSISNSAEHADNGVFHVRAYSWRGRPDFTQDFLKAYLPASLELPFERMVKFIRIEDKLDFSVPVATLSFSHSAEAGAIHISPQKYSLMDETLMILACRQTEYDREAPALTGPLDALGLISLLSGSILHGRSLFSCYFCTTRKKFLFGALGVVGASPLDWAPIKFSDSYPDAPLDARDDRTHAALWFAGLAFSANDNASKVVSYVTALEILTSKNIKNYLSHLYRKKSELHAIAINHVLALLDLRADLVHKGRRVVLSPDLERYAQAFILDAIRENKKLVSASYAVERLVSVKGPAPAKPKLQS